MTPLICVIENDAQFSSAMISTGKEDAAPEVTASTRGPRSVTPKWAAKSRATPRWPQQSARLRVRSRSNTTSCSMPSASNGLTPNGVSLGRIRSPDDSSLSPSSTSEHNMPSESIPKMPRRAIFMPFGIVVPSVASGTTSPSLMLVAPHHT